MLRPLTPDELKKLSPYEQQEYLEHLEALHRSSGKDSFLQFVGMVECPGAPMDRPEPEIYYPQRLVPAAHHKLIIQAIQDIADGKEDDLNGLMIFCPPGAAKSSYASTLAPPWLMGHTPGTNIISASYGQDLANRFGRRARTVVKSPEYQSIMGCTLNSDNAKVDEWAISNGSDYRAAGLGAGITGFRADWFFIDDPIKNREDADSQTIRDKVWAGFSDDVDSRLKPGGKICLIQCMTGDTLVLMASGIEKPLRDVRPGDCVATYEDGKVATSTVLNWANNGPDRVLEIRMKSGITVRANARHPFLVDDNGWVKWQRTASIKKGSAILGVTGVSGRGLSAPQMGVIDQPSAKASACRTIIKVGGPLAFARLRSTLGRVGKRICDIVMALTSWNLSESLSSKVGLALYAGVPLATTTLRPTGPGSFASITATTVKRSGAFSATVAMSRSATLGLRNFYLPPLSTYEITADTVVDIVEAGVEDVYDIQVERTENFIANGLVSHNTRWHEDDLAGRILGSEWKGQSGLWRGSDFRLWKIINLPLIAEHPDDPLGRKPGQLLWPEWFRPEDAERRQKAAAKGGSAARTWSSLYQQRPAPAEGSILLRSYWNEWKKTKKVISQDGEVKEIPDPPECNMLMLSYDTALEDDEQNDPSAMTAWGVFDSISTKKTGEQYHHQHAILLGAWDDHVQAADLADIIQDHYRFFKPDLILIEKRASGAQVLQELKRLRLPVKAWLPKGKPGAKGKVPRAHAIAMMLEQGAVHYIPGTATQKVIDQCASFPNGTHDDLVDTVTCALAYFRDRFMFQTADEEMDGEEHKAYLQDQMDQSRMGRRLYNGDAPQRRAQNERRIYSESTSTRVQDDATERMTDETRRRLYGE
jgi:phage terminase large subunit-like protein